MPALEWLLFLLLAVGVSLAAWSLSGARALGSTWQTAGLVATLVFFGASAVLAAAHRAEMLIYVGIAAGGFIAVALWERPRETRFSDQR
jgi:hypothetical protein